jgi:hypothetical protein
VLQVEAAQLAAFHADADEASRRPGWQARGTPPHARIFPRRRFLRGMEIREIWEVLSYVVTVIGLPFAIVVFILEQRKERQNDQEEIFQRLSDEYREFLKLVLDNADLQLLRRDAVPRTDFTPEQSERRFAIFGILVSLFERAYLLVYEEKMDKQTRRLWQSWEDYMREWVRRADFRGALPELLQGEDEDFTHYIRALADAESGHGRNTPAAPAA